MKINKLISCMLIILMFAGLFCSCAEDTKNNGDISTRNVVCFNGSVEYAGDDYITVSAGADVESGGARYFSQGDKITVKYADVAKFNIGNYVSVTFDGDVFGTGSTEITATSITKLLDYDVMETPSVFDGENYIQTSPVLSEDAPKLTFLKNDDENSEFTACENSVLYNGISVYGESPLMTTGYGYAKKTDDFKFVTLKFEKQPDFYSVRGWKEESIGNTSDALKAVNVESENNIINLDGDEVVFEITASWDNGDKIIYSLYVGEAG